MALIVYPFAAGALIPATTDQDYLCFDELAFESDADERYVTYFQGTVPNPGTYLITGTVYAEEFKAYIWQGASNGKGLIGKRGSVTIDNVTYEHEEGPNTITDFAVVTGDDDDNVFTFVAVTPRLYTGYAYAQLAIIG